MRRVRNGADKPRRQSPCLNVFTGHGENSADEEVDQADKERRANPRLPI
jgi:hypothetical protein